MFKYYAHIILLIEKNHFFFCITLIFGLITWLNVRDIYLPFLSSIYLPSDFHH